MENNYTKVERISNEGYQLEFGTILEDAFKNYKKIVGIGGVAMLLVTIVLFVIFGGLFAALYGFGNFTSSLTGLNPAFMSGSNLIYFFLTSVFIGALFSPINAGMIKMAYQAHHNKTFGLDTVFEYYKAPYFKELFIAGTIIAFAGNGVNYLLQYFGIILFGTLLTYGILFLTFLTIPLLIFSNLKAVEAIKMSIKLVLKQPLLLLGLLIVSVVLICLGIFGFCIGVFFTIPFLYSMYFTIYAAIIPFSEKNVLDEIGQNQE